MKKILLLTSVVFVFQLFFTINAFATVINTDQDRPMKVSVTTTEGKGFILDQTNKKLPNGDYFWIRKYTFSQTSKEDLITSISVPGTKGTVTYLDPATSIWKSIPLSGKMPNAILHIDTDTHHIIINPAFNYKKRENNSLEANNALTRQTTVTKNANGFVLNIRFAKQAGTEGHIWALHSSEPLVVWNDNLKTLWARYDNLKNSRFAYDGYYYTTSTAYEPYSKSMYWRNPSSYIPASFVENGDSRAADDLGYAMIDTVANNQEAAGYWLTGPRSYGRVYNEYGIDKGFYDTRFNADITQALFTLAQKTGDKYILNAAVKQSDFFVWYAENHKYEYGDLGPVGWLVEDYYHPNMTYNKTHVSLNHQLRELYVMYLAYRVTGDEKYLVVADYLINGINAVGTAWIKPDYSLHYAYLPNGSLGIMDYPYLTYNDLYDVQMLRDNMGLGKDPNLQALINAKLIHMGQNNITAYKR